MIDFTKNAAEESALGEDTEIVFRAESFAKTVREFLKVGMGLLVYTEVNAMPGYFIAKAFKISENGEIND